MWVMSRLSINAYNDDDHNEALVERQRKAHKGYDTVRYYNSIPIGSTQVVQYEDGGLWTHGTILDKGDCNHNDQSCKIQVTKTGQLIIRKANMWRQHHQSLTIFERPAFHGHKDGQIRGHPKTNSNKHSITMTIAHEKTATNQTVQPSPMYDTTIQYPGVDNYTWKIKKNRKFL